MKEYICSECHFIGKPQLVKKTSKAFQVLSWIIFPFGYIFYFIWQIFNKSIACQQCGGTMLVDKTTPVGRRLISIHAPGMEEAYGVEPAPVTKKPEVHEEPKFTEDDFLKAERELLGEATVVEPLPSTRVERKAPPVAPSNNEHEW